MKAGNQSLESAKQATADLVERFARNLHAYRSAGYNEAQVRREFIEPFFEALGWDVSNRAGYAEAYKDVVLEGSLKVSGATEAPDYCFRVGGQRKFFLEAKKPSVDVKGGVGPAYQLRRYAWSAKLPLSILTDFEEFAVYDCRQRPKPADGAATARIMYLHFTQYLDRFSDVYEVFAREPLLRGSFDRYAESATAKRGTQEVDAAFLAEIEEWRESLAKNLALRNRDLTVRQLNFAVQATIDRILFLRLCEDRGIEAYAQLQALRSGGDTYRRLFHLFRLADDKYNAGLFDFKADTLTPALTLDDRVLKEIFARLYYPESPYEFSVLGADLLGNVYEQFLGKVIRLTPGHQAKVEEKPEVKKAGGVYYTPQYIVEYIVKQTVGKLVEGKTPRQVAKLRALDPACGSGSFLLGAYQYLLDWHRDWYVNDGPQKHTNEVYQVASVVRGSPDPAQCDDRRSPIRPNPDGLETCGQLVGGVMRPSPNVGEWRLTTREKKRILLNCIYGVDIDPQAVEVTKLSLLLKVLEGENQDTLQQQFTLWRERALPDLGNNIKCGNSLIGPDFYAQGTLDLDEEEMFRINAFDWDKEFPEIMKAGGFDAVIGNPPYLSFSGRQKPEGYVRELQYWKKHYPWDSWPTMHGMFMVRALSLRRRTGYVAFIVPDQVGHLAGYGSLRREATSRASLVEVRYWGERVFAGVVTPALTFVFGEGGGGQTCIVARNGETCLRRLSGDSPWVAERHAELVAKLRARGVSLGESVKDPGVHTGNCASALLVEGGDVSGQSVPLLEGKQVSRYHCLPPCKRLHLDYSPRAGEYFTIRPVQHYREAAFVLRQTASHPIAGPKEGAEYFRNSLLALYPWPPHDLRYVVGLLNSRLIRFFYEVTTTEAGQNAFPQVKVRAIRSLPIRPTNFTSRSDVAKHDRMVLLVDRMLDLHKRLAAAQTPTEREMLQRQIDAMDQQIDALVYELYELTEEEIGIVEGGHRGGGPRTGKVKGAG